VTDIARTEISRVDDNRGTHTVPLLSRVSENPMNFQSVHYALLVRAAHSRLRKQRWIDESSTLWTLNRKAAAKMGRSHSAPESIAVITRD
jgi:hypothetical protein